MGRLVNPLLALGLDPDSHASSWAILALNPGGGEPELLEVGVCSVAKSQKGAKAVTGMAGELVLLRTKHAPQIIVVEGQQIYARSRAKPDSILQLAQVAGAAVAAMRIKFPSAQVLIPRPGEWKGDVPKRIHQARLWNRLGVEYESRGTPAAGYAVPKGLSCEGAGKVKRADWKHLADAVGLAEWGLRRGLRRLRAG